MESTAAILQIILLSFFFAAAHSASLPSSGCIHQPPKQEHETDNSKCDYNYLDKRTLIHDIESFSRIIINTSSIIHNKLLGSNSLWATVGLYNDLGTDSIAPRGHMSLSQVHSLLAASVSIYQTFLRPLGVALTNETVREIVYMERDTVRRELTDIYDSLAAVAMKTYQLIKNDINIHGCQVPNVPAKTNAALKPSHLQQEHYSRHILIMDGLANELQVLAVNVVLLLDCMGHQTTGTCDFPK